MINRIEIASINGEVDLTIEKYAKRKIGKLDRYMPLGARRSVHAEIKFQEQRGKANKNERYTCEVILHLPNGMLAAKESTLNMFAAIDIVEAKLKNQLRKYKEKHRAHRTDRKGMLQKISRITDRDFWGRQN